MSDTIASNLNLDISEKQKFLENFNVSKRIDDLIIKLETEIGSLQAENKVRSRVKRQMEKIQREYYLNEQLKAIQKELGTSEDGKNEFQELKTSETYKEQEQRKGMERKRKRSRKRKKTNNRIGKEEWE